MAVAEAIAESMRGGRTGSGEGPEFSEISVAPNGFINFEADFGSPLVSSVSSHTLEYARTCIGSSGHLLIVMFPKVAILRALVGLEVYSKAAQSTYNVSKHSLQVGRINLEAYETQHPSSGH